MSQDCSIELRNVTQRFRIIRERSDTLREVFAKLRQRKTTYHEFDALKQISFRVGRGEMVGVIGRNGSGKSTILKVVAGVYAPTQGRVIVNGSIAPLIELGAGFHHELTGRENIVLNGLLLGLSRKQVAERTDSIINFSELGDFIDAPVKQYSSGMYMRLAFSIATEVDPDILLMDEILAVGDSGFQQKCFDRIQAFRNAGKTILFVSHDSTSIQRLCNRVMLIHDGCLIESGPPSLVIARYDELMAQMAGLILNQA